MNRKVTMSGAGMALWVLALTGCQESEGIREYTAKRDTDAKPAAMKKSGPIRTLAAIFPQEKSTWFVKLMGPASQLETQAPNFFQWIDSFKFVSGNPVFETPAGWTKAPGNQDRFTTMKLPPEAGGLEATVISLGGMGGSTLDNINRWRDQLGLAPVEEADLPKNIKEKDVNGVKVVLFDATGPGNASGGRMPPFAGSKAGSARPAPPPMAAEGPESGGAPFEIKLPPGWKEIKPKPVTFKTYQAGAAEVTLTFLPGDAGGVAANINRWRGQVDLPTLPPEKVLAETQNQATPSGPALLVDLAGTKGNRIIGAIIVQPKGSWFVKMTGTNEATSKEKDALFGLIRELKLPESR